MESPTVADRIKAEINKNIEILSTDRDVVARRGALRRLAKVDGEVVLTALLDALNLDEDPTVRVNAAKAIGERDDSKFRMNALVTLENKIRSDSSHLVREAAVVALGLVAHGAEIETSVVIQAMKHDRSVNVQMKAARVLGTFKNSIAVRALIATALETRHAPVRKVAAASLRAIGGTEAEEILEAKIREPEISNERILKILDVMIEFRSRKHAQLAEILADISLNPEVREKAKTLLRALFSTPHQIYQG
jgi:HEAT repeat protein